MNIKNLLIQSIGFLLLSAMAFASGGVKKNEDPLLKTFITNSKKTTDRTYQNHLRSLSAWTNFHKKHNSWMVVFNEGNQKPHRAVGTPVFTGGATTRAVAENFMASELNEFKIPGEMEYVSTATSSKYHYVNYIQKYQGLEVLFSKVQIKMTLDHGVMQYGLDCFDNISISAQPSLNSQAAIQKATDGVNGVTGITVNPDLKILPVPAYRSYNFHLVYEITVENRDAAGIPGRYYTLVDANNGEILYRTNRINHVSANTDVNVTGTLHLTHPYDPATVEPLKNLRIITNGNTDYTDDTGYLGLTATTPTTASFSLQGRWVRVYTNGSTPSWTVTLNPGINNINIDGNTDIKQRTTYNAINTVHDFMKGKYPTFTGLDNPLPANVDVAGSCNAFYDGSSVNFFAAGGGCNATSLVADVCYHEYGHAINDKFYQSIGANFGNGAMGEGYADIWALGITDSPILGIGFFQNDSTGFVRRYDIDKKVYPQDLVGEVHADGEIIAGCFWDTYLNLGNLQQMMDLFSQSFYAGLSEPDGQEGILFQDILLEVLTLDDNDGNLSNGTPNYCAITSGFAIHGISLTAMAGITHTEVLQSPALLPINVDATIQGLAAGSLVKGYFRVGNTGSWTMFPITNVTGNNYQGIIPPQAVGTIIEYYMGIEDDCGTFLGVIPGGADDPVNPNIPYYILVGFNELIYEDFDNFFGAWIETLPTDNNLTGDWIVTIPIPSYVGNGMVQTDYQVTPGGLFCAVTGNAMSPNSPAGDNDVDGGYTTLLSPDYDMTSYSNPAFTFHRWYSNDQGATPGTDFWQVSISNDGGSTWVPVENTNVADHSWRRFAFRVLDYVSLSSTVTLRFIAEDANAGSLIEAALDDLKVWDEISVGTNEIDAIATVSVFPNPANSGLNINVGIVRDENVEISLFNNLGQMVYYRSFDMEAGNNLMNIDIAGLAEGLYQAKIMAGDSETNRKFSIIR